MKKVKKNNKNNFKKITINNKYIVLLFIFIILLILFILFKKINVIENFNSKDEIREDNEFDRIFIENKWNSNESLSGPGSEIKKTKNIRKMLPILINKFKINSVCDIPCGDFNWMRLIIEKIPNYIGGDVVKELIEQNKKKYKNINFIHIDLIKDKIPDCDLILIRDCLFHLSYKDINKVINNLKKSKIKYILTTNFVNRKNFDIKSGGWRPICLQNKPFNWKDPIYIINENENSEYKDKHMGLWKINDL